MKLRIVYFISTNNNLLALNPLFFKS